MTKFGAFACPTILALLSTTAACGQSTWPRSPDGAVGVRHGRADGEPGAARSADASVRSGVRELSMTSGRGFTRHDARAAS